MRAHRVLDALRLSFSSAAARERARKICFSPVCTQGCDQHVRPNLLPAFVASGERAALAVRASLQFRFSQNGALALDAQVVQPRSTGALLY